MTARIIVDVANYQGIPNFVALKAAGVQGVIIKATEGAWKFTNPFFDAQVAAARAAGLAVGFYTFEHPGIADQSDAQLFLDRIAGINPELGVWLDCEVSDGVPAVQMLPRLLADAQYIAKRYPLKTGFYTAPWWWDPNTIGSAQAHMENWPLWLAGYTQSLPPSPAPWKSPILWQFTDKFAGLDLDASYFLGSDAQWRWLLTGQNGGTAPADPSWTEKIIGVQKSLHAAPDGIFGPDTDRRGEIVREFKFGPASLTAQHVSDFQRMLGVPINGKWDPSLQKLLGQCVTGMQSAMGVKPVTGVWDTNTEFSYLVLDPLR